MSLKEWKNDEINTKLMKKWGFLKEGAKPDFLDLDKDGDKEEPMKSAAKEHDDEEGNRPSMAKKMDLDEEQAIFAPNHYCVHHGGVQHEGQVKMAEAINHNFDKKLNKVTWYDMKLQDGTILEQVAAEKIMVTNASIAEGHSHPMRDEDEDELEEGSAGDWSKMAQKKDPTDLPGGMTVLDRAQIAKAKSGPKVKAKRKNRAAGGDNIPAKIKLESDKVSPKISVREAKEITRRIIERIKLENK